MDLTNLKNSGAGIAAYGVLFRDNSDDTAKIVLGQQVDGGYFVCEELPESGTWQIGQLCYCTGTAQSPVNKFYQYTGTGDKNGWVESSVMNQNAFSKVVVGGVTIEADSITDMLTLESGGNITISPDATNDKVTFSVANGTTSQKGVVQLSSEASSSEESKAATPKGVQNAINALDVDAPTVPASGTTTATAFIDSVSQTDGKISATKKNLPTASTSTPGIVQLSSTASSSAENVAATPKGVQAAINALDVAEPTASGTSTTFIATAKQENGKIVVTKKNIPATTYTNATPIVTAIGSIKAGDTFDNVTIQDMLTKILYPYVEIEVGTATASPSTGSYDAKSTPTLSSVSIYVKKNSATNLSFKLYDTTQNTQVGSTLTEANISSDNKLTFSGLNYTIDTTRTFAIKYTYKGSSGATSSEKTVTVGTFTITFTNPTLGTLTSNFSKTSWYAGQTATATQITASLNSLNSAKKITKLELYRGSTLVTSANNPFDSSNSYTFTNLSESLTSSSTSTTSTNYKVRAYFQNRTATDATWKDGGYVDSSNLTITFTYQAPSIAISGISSGSYSKLLPQTISANSISANVAKNSSTLSSVSLSIDGSSTATDSTTTSSLTKLKASGYDSNTYNVKFAHKAITTCSNLTITATAAPSSGSDKTSSATLSFYAPYCWGFVDAGTTFSSVDRSTFTNLTQSSTKQTSINLSAPGSLKKFIYAVPNGTFTKATDSSGEDNFGLFEKNSGGYTKTITWADDSSTTYQILILKGTTAAAVKLNFS